MTHVKLVLTVEAFRIYSQALTEAGAISKITLGDAIKCIGITAILTGRIQIRNPEFGSRQVWGSIRRNQALECKVGQIKFMTKWVTRM